MRTITDYRTCGCHNCKRKLDMMFWLLILFNFPNERVPEDGA